MRRIFIWALIFIAGFVCGKIDTYIRTPHVTITGKCVNVGVTKSYGAIFQSINGKIIRDDKRKTEIYSAVCQCTATDRKHGSVIFASVDFSSSDASGLSDSCTMACTAYCTKKYSDFQFAESK